MEYNKKLLDDAKTNFEKASIAYAQYADANLHSFQEKIRQKLAELETPMGQFGCVQLLSNLLFDKKTTTKVTFFQQTGGTKDVME